MTSAIIQPYGVIFAKHHMYTPFIICGGYLGFIYLFSNYMKYNVSFSLKQPLIYWNASLCIFSFVGALQTIPLLFHLIYNSNEQDKCIKKQSRMQSQCMNCHQNGIQTS